MGGLAIVRDCATLSLVGDDPASARDRVERVWQTLRRAMARACPPELAACREDLVHAALLRMLERERRGEVASVRSASYVWRVAFSVVADELRRQRRRPEVAATAEQPEPRTTEEPDLTLALRACLLKLPEPRRLAVTLHLQGFTVEEAGRMLGWNARRVRNLVFRGMVELRRCLGAQEGQ